MPGFCYLPGLATLPPSGGEGRVLRMAAVSQKRVLQCDKRRVSKYYYPGEHNWRRIRTRVKVGTKATVRKDKVGGSIIRRRK